MRHYSDLITLFNNLFKNAEDTVLVSGGDEPLYLPKNEKCHFNQIIFREDFYASALHEIAHWCIASKERRQLVDYGYWYQPDGRLPEEQKLFEQVESKPQAIEWIFSMAAGSQFRISQDNLAGNAEISESFQYAIAQHAFDYLQNGLPNPAELFKKSLIAFYKSTPAFNLLSLPDILAVIS